jgi:hypothetical protein
MIMACNDAKQSRIKSMDIYVFIKAEVFPLTHWRWGTQMCVFYLLVVGDEGRRCAFFAHISIHALCVLCL